ncbi:MAG: pyrroloquinoline quinone biosynthesis protein B [Rhodothermales bacterium]
MTKRWLAPLLLGLLLLMASVSACSPETETPKAPLPVGPFVIVLGVGQDGGVPQTGDWDHPGWDDPAMRKLVSALGVVDPRSGASLLFDATPDITRQLRKLSLAGATGMPDIFLTHAHMGHYTGLMRLGHESLGASDVPVHAMPRMADYLATNGPWSQLVGFQNIDLRPLASDSTMEVGVFRVTPLEVPHRQEFSEVVGYRVEGPNRSLLFIPDIDSWEEWDAMGRRIEDEIAQVDVAYLDATFFANGEIPGRDMSGFPHPFITHTMVRLASLPPGERAKVRFIHLNHTNPALWPGPERDQIVDAGFRVALEGEVVAL